MFCQKCNIEKEIIDFKGPKARICILCQKLKEAERKKQYYLDNKEYINERTKIYWAKNKTTLNEFQREYWKENKEKLQPNRTAYRKNKIATDICFKLRNIISSTILYALKHQKGVSCLKYLPYTIQELKTHLESLWEPWMNWDNYGLYTIGGERKWNIDHIIPQSKLPYDSMAHSNFLKCWALENLQPLDAIANIVKSNK